MHEPMTSRCDEQASFRCNLVGRLTVLLSLRGDGIDQRLCQCLDSFLWSRDESQSFYAVTLLWHCIQSHDSSIASVSVTWLVS